MRKFFDLLAMYEVVRLILLKLGILCLSLSVLRSTVTILRPPFMYRREYASFVRSCGIAHNGLMKISMS